MHLYLRKSDDGQLGPEIYRVILKDEDGDEVEIGSISVQHRSGAEYFWKWAIDTVIPMRAFETSGRGKDRADCMRLFKAAWERFADDEANLTMFLAEKRRSRRTR
jgi:hypothetical protein